MGAWGVVYVATNLITGDQYVGQTKQPPHIRFRAHEISSRTPTTKFHQAISSTGYDNFEFEVVASSFSREDLNATEKAVIAERKPTYNSTTGGAGRPRLVSDTERMRLSEASKHRWANPEWREKTTASIRKAAGTEAYRERGRNLGQTATGAKARWEFHTPKPKITKDRGHSISTSWGNPDVRERRLLGMLEANKRPDVRVKRSMAARGRTIPASSVAKVARSKWKPVYCPELQVTFLSRLATAEYIGVGKTTVSEALRRGHKIAGSYTVREVCHQL